MNPPQLFTKYGFRVDLDIVSVDKPLDTADVHLWVVGSKVVEVQRQVQDALVETVRKAQRAKVPIFSVCCVDEALGEKLSGLRNMMMAGV